MNDFISRLKEKNELIYQIALFHKNEVMEIVSAICSTPPENCRGLDKAELALQLFEYSDIKCGTIFTISEIPLCWSNQVDIYFVIYGDPNYYSLFAGIGNDGSFCYQIEIIGHYDNKEKCYIVDD